MTWHTWSLKDVMASRPRIRVNQVGYLRNGPKRATLICEAVDPQPFSLVAPGGTEVFAGRSLPWPTRPEATSGQLVHVLDFSGVPTKGSGWRLTADGTTSHPFQIGEHPYDTLRDDALSCFYLMRSGCSIDDERAPGYGRPAGHLDVAPNRGDTRVAAWAGPDADRLYPGWRQPGTFDISGGWYDAGDYDKYVTSGCIAVWHLLSALEVLVRRPAATVPATFREQLAGECRWGSSTGCCG
jgi:endoglucanase